MKTILGSICVGLLLCLATAVQAIVWTDDQSIGKRLKEGKSFSGTFELDSFDPLLHTISSVSVSFAFSDGRLWGDIQGDWADIKVGSDWMWTGLEVDGTRRFGFDWVSESLGGHLIADPQ